MSAHSPSGARAERRDRGMLPDSVLTTSPACFSASSLLIPRACSPRLPSSFCNLRMGLLVRRRPTWTFPYGGKLQKSHHYANEVAIVLSVGVSHGLR